jgi:1-deoxy-D-xylulose-5-phosphate reductoisomerase
MTPIKINILGATGSIGQSTLDVIAAQSERFDVRLLTAHSNRDGLLDAATKCAAAATAFEDIEAAIEAAGPVDITVAAISGMAGLEPLLAAIRTSRVVAIANKEPLVAAGALVMQAAEEAGCTILPLDSEHNAVFQVFNRTQEIERIVLTASGGPFRTWSLEQMRHATPEQALKHPNWEMGRKITIDSATMMNKALEIIEACVLFDLKPEQVDVLIHPQSAVHGMVEYKDGSILAQLGASDMRTPIASVLAWPERLRSGGARLDLASLARLDFEAPDVERFPAIALAYEALGKGQHACIALNAANEIAVSAFLDRQIGFADIVVIVRVIMDSAPVEDFSSITDIIDYDNARRNDATAYIESVLNYDGLRSGKKDFA